MNCPKCETRPLVATQVKGVEVDRCPQCHGIWFDDKELSSLLELDRKDLRGLQAGKEDELLNRKRGTCPRDGSKLLRVYSADNQVVVLDTCVKCSGIWLDGGELSKLVKG